MKVKAKLLPVVFLVFATLWLRLVNLGYSDYQGDEIKALSLPGSDQGLVGFLIEQRKGPVQFIITYLINLVHPTFSSEFLTRLPFALTGILAIFFFYQFVKLHFGSKTALYATLFLTVNGIFIGLMRIVQYQPFVILFSILALYTLSLALKSEKWKIAGIYAGISFWALALFAHYDGVFIAPFVVYLLYRWYNKYPDLSAKNKIKHIAIPGAVCTLLLASFYAPFFLSISRDTQAYWLSRATGIQEKAEPSSSIVTFRLYNPLFVIYIYLAFGLLSLLKIRSIFPIVLWFLFPWIIFEGVIYDPGTHIYTYLIPATILLSIGVGVFEDGIKKLTKGKYGIALSASGLAIAFVLLFSLSHFIFIDHTPEYPWEERRFLFWTLGKPDTEAHIWAFGFPYYRHWEEIGEFVSSTENNGFYSTNEKKSIAFHYVPYQFNIDKSRNYIHIHNPQSFRDKLSDDKIRYWTKRYHPVKVFENEGRVVAEIYNMPEGSVSEIKEAGY